MRKVKEVNETIEDIKELLIGIKVELPSDVFEKRYSMGLEGYNEFRGAIKALRWVLYTEPKKPKDADANEKLQKFGLQNPIKKK